MFRFEKHIVNVLRRLSSYTQATKLYPDTQSEAHHYQQSVSYKLCIQSTLLRVELTTDEPTVNKTRSALETSLRLFSLHRSPLY